MSQDGDLELNIQENSILYGDIPKGIIRMAVPLMFLSLINTAYTLVDTYFVGKISELSIGAVSLVAPIVSCGTACIVGLCAAAVALISRAIGEGDKDKAIRATNHVFAIGCIFGMAVGVVFLLGRDFMLGWLETPEEIYNDTRNYLTGISLDVLFAFILSFFQSVRQASGDTKIGVRINICACLLNCILDPLFILVFQLGTFGAAVATVCSKVIMTPVALVLLCKKDQVAHLSNGVLHLQKNVIWTSLKVAFPSTLGQFLASFGFVLMSKEIVSYGAIIMSAYGIGGQISSLFYIPLNGIGSALVPYIGQNLGNNNPLRARESYRKAMTLTAIASLLFTIIGFFLAPYAIHLFIKNASDLLVHEALVYAYFSIFTSFCMGWFGNLISVFQGSGNTLIAMILSACRLFVVRIPIIMLLSRYTNLGHIGIWVAMVVSNLIICFAGQLLYRFYSWEKKKLAY